MTDWRIADELADGRWLAPSAERNKAPIAEVLRRFLPARGTVLEIGSGTGQHVVHFARAFPALAWQPTDPDARMRRSIAAWIAHEKLANALAPLALDVEEAAWPVAHADALIAINVVHVSPWSAVPALMAGAARVLPAGAPLFLYGPYRRDGAHTAPGNERFDALLRAHDPRWGVRDVEAVTRAGRDAGLRPLDAVGMPANNLTLVLARDGAR
jgi:SAM-dependent methyltransferase